MNTSSAFCVRKSEKLKCYSRKLLISVLIKADTVSEYHKAVTYVFRFHIQCQ